MADHPTGPQPIRGHASVLSPHESASPVRSRTRTLALWWIAALSGLAMSTIYHMSEFLGPTVVSGIEVASPSIATVVVDVCLGVLALVLLPAAIAHDPMEREESYVGPPSALVAGLVVLSVWMVSVMAAPAGAIALISISSRLSANWTVPAVLASFMSMIVFELTLSHDDPGIRWTSVALSMLVALCLVGMGSIRGKMLRTQMRRHPED